MAQLGWLLGSGIGEYPGCDDDLVACRRLALILEDATTDPSEGVTS
jgi:hypothetical protein